MDAPLNMQEDGQCSSFDAAHRPYYEETENIIRIIQIVFDWCYNCRDDIHHRRYFDAQRFLAKKNKASKLTFVAPLIGRLK